MINGTNALRMLEIAMVLAALYEMEEETVFSLKVKQETAGNVARDTHLPLRVAYVN